MTDCSTSRLLHFTLRHCCFGELEKPRNSLTGVLVFMGQRGRQPGDQIQSVYQIILMALPIISLATRFEVIECEVNLRKISTN